MYKASGSTSPVQSPAGRRRSLHAHSAKTNRLHSLTGHQLERERSRGKLFKKGGGQLLLLLLMISAARKVCPVKEKQTSDLITSQSSFSAEH